eukprot:5053799-Prymnesium_polylepis.1
MLVCSTQLFSRLHPRKHPADPHEHLERSVGLRPSGGRPTALVLYSNHILHSRRKTFRQFEFRAICRVVRSPVSGGDW